MAACPYERRFFTWGEPPIPPEAAFVEYSPEHQVPLKRGVVAKCDFCPEMARAGRLPFCAQACPNDAIYYGDLEEDIATNGREVVQFSRHLSQNAAYWHKPQWGTKPRVWYIPGHGQEAGRDAFNRGRKQTKWAWQERLEGVETWKRSGH
jgi:molybdopterin-containing oxidoreductase family iron-sulfur binding subunit